MMEPMESIADTMLKIIDKKLKFNSQFEKIKTNFMQTTSFKVTGSRPLSGHIIPKGAKNEALQIIVVNSKIIVTANYIKLFI